MENNEKQVIFTVFSKKLDWKVIEKKSFSTKKEAYEYWEEFDKKNGNSEDLKASLGFPSYIKE